jgi:PAS domain S-box-containing protein
VNDDDLRESLQELYEQAPCGYVFCRPDGRFVRVNQTFLDWTGYARAELVPSKRLQELLTVPGKIFYENQYAPLLRMQGFVKEVAFDLVRPGREPLPVLVNSVQRLDAEGRPRLVASTVFDATDRRAYERELLLARRRAEQLAAVVTAAGDAILSATADGVLQTWNEGAERLFGYPASDVVGRGLGQVLPIAGDEAEWRRILGDLAAGRPVHLETNGRRADGRSVDVSVGLAPHAGHLGELVAVSAIVRDISERRALERMQQEFLAMASHELRSPVTAIRGRAQLMRRRGAYSEVAVDAIVEQSDRLVRLIADLLLASRIEADRLDLLLAETDVAAEARAAAESVAAQGHVVHVEAPAEPLVVLADSHRLGQVFANLLTNAVKYSPGGREIVVRVERDGAAARVQVIDQGVGIPAEALPRLFDRFYRVSETARGASGLGLGLYISRRIVEAHGGTIAVASVPGQGSTFTVTLPLGAPDRSGGGARAWPSA